MVSSLPTLQLHFADTTLTLLDPPRKTPVVHLLEVAMFNIVEKTTYTPKCALKDFANPYSIQMTNIKYVMNIPLTWKCYTQPIVRREKKRFNSSHFY